MIKSFLEIGNLKIITTEKAKYFYDDLPCNSNVKVFNEMHEWSFNKKSNMNQWYIDTPRTVWEKDDPVLHIEARKWADILVIAPLSANTLAKMANGLCDNLLTSVVRAWEPHKPVVIAPAMNTVMWESKFTNMHLDILNTIFDLHQVGPVEKGLACGDTGMGAMAHIDDIAQCIDQALAWGWPLPGRGQRTLPKGKHPGAYGYKRHTSYHTGVDLYVPMEKLYITSSVIAVEAGVVSAVIPFTGKAVNMDWWNDTEAVIVEGKSGAVLYGEIMPRIQVVGTKVRKGDIIGDVIPVIKAGGNRPDVPGHSRAMLHLELYPAGTTEWHPWTLEQTSHVHLDPTDLLMNEFTNPTILPEWEGDL